MGERSLSEKDIHDMERNAEDPEFVKRYDRRKGDRRKAINSTVEPKHDRRQHDRRKIGK